jgi:ligand-binding sensor domain-containing protein
MLRHVGAYAVLIFVFCASCKGRNKTELPLRKDTTNSSKPGPQVIGTPPSPVSDFPRPSELEQALTDHNAGLLVSQVIRSIFQDLKGNFWFGPAGESVARYDEKTLKYYGKDEFFQGNDRVDRGGSSVHAIAEDKKGDIWFGTDHGAIKYDGKTFRSYDEENGLSNIKVGRKSILIDKAGNIWVGTEGGVFRYTPSADSTGGKCFSRFRLLPPVTVKDIMEDKTGNIWFASQDDGVFRYDGRAIKNITGPEGLGDNVAGGMIEDKTGKFWFTMNGGICRYDGRAFTEFTTKDGLGGSEVLGIYIEKSGIIWITARGSTTRLDPSIPVLDSKAFTVFTSEEGINCCVQSMYQDRSGNMWWGTGDGLYRFDGKRFYQVKQNGPW